MYITEILIPGDGAQRWTKPVRNTFKINVDASIFEAEEHFGFGWVARKMKADRLQQEWMQKGKSGRGLAEAMGVKEALSWLESH